MAESPQSPEVRCGIYAAQRGLAITGNLGRGVHGSVYSSNTITAIKGHKQPESYRRELDCYNRLMEQNVTEIYGHHVPQLVSYDDDFLVIEITIVTPPFLLDFGGAYLDWPPEFSDEVMEQWASDKQEQFGKRWASVQRILAFLRDVHGIYMLDVNPGNIMFGGEWGRRGKPRRVVSCELWVASGGVANSRFAVFSNACRRRHG
ncbi:MAG TPA: hypothetical protein VKJ65_10320 [Phycisphaerae bacterium]|nr:hypothetical protein [Phycisphaerae bacterium]